MTDELRARGRSNDLGYDGIHRLISLTDGILHYRRLHHCNSAWLYRIWLCPDCDTTPDLVLPPSSVVPIILVIEILASLQLLPQVWSRIGWRAARGLLLGASTGSPLSVLTLERLSGSMMQFLIASIALLSTLMLALEIKLLSLALVPFLFLGQLIGSRFFDENKRTAYQRVSLALMTVVNVVARAHAFLA